MAIKKFTLIALLRNAGIAANDDDALRLNKTLLVLATGLVSFASMLWLPIYWDQGAERSAALTVLFQSALAGNLLGYLRSKNFHTFRLRQLGLFLLFPFVAQWSVGHFESGSGMILWGLLGPVAAMLCFGVAESRKWFAAYVSLIVLTAGLELLFTHDQPLPGWPFIRPNGTLFFILNCALISSILYLLLRYALQKKQRLESMLIEANTLLQLEQARSQRLLRNILPASVAERLKSSDQPIADRFPNVTVMFADIVNFTPVAATLSPVDVFAMLNRIFSRFDELVDEHGLEKIKTIGDAYMVASGLTATGHNDTHAMAALALAMQDTLRAGFLVHGKRLHLRIGMATGPVVAGVVGKRKFSYDLWGDTVNIASRLSTEAAPGTILIDAPTQARIAHDFTLIDSGTLPLKGRGVLQAYRLSGPDDPDRPAWTSIPPLAIPHPFIARAAG